MKKHNRLLFLLLIILVSSLLCGFKLDAFAIAKEGETKKSATAVNDTYYKGREAAPKNNLPLYGKPAEDLEDNKSGSQQNTKIESKANPLEVAIKKLTGFFGQVILVSLLVVVIFSGVWYLLKNPNGIITGGRTHSRGSGHSSKRGQSRSTQQLNHSHSIKQYNESSQMSFNEETVYRIGDLEERVSLLEKQLANINWNLKTMNDAHDRVSQLETQGKGTLSPEVKNDKSYNRGIHTQGDTIYINPSGYTNPSGDMHPNNYQTGYLGNNQNNYSGMYSGNSYINSNMSQKQSFTFLDRYDECKKRKDEGSFIQQYNCRKVILENYQSLSLDPSAREVFVEDNQGYFLTFQTGSGDYWLIPRMNAPVKSRYLDMFSRIFNIADEGIANTDFKLKVPARVRAIDSGRYVLLEKGSIII